MDIDTMTIDSIEIRLAKNGFHVIIRTEDDENDYVFDSHQKLLRFLKPILMQSSKK